MSAGKASGGGASSAGGGSDIFSVKELVRIDNFKDKFSTKGFVENLSARVVAASSSGDNSDGKDFEPKPYIRTFDSASDELLRLKKRVQSKIDDQEDQMAASDLGRRRKMREFSEAFDDVQRAFESLDSRLSEVGNTAIRIGEQLETIDKQKTRAAEAKDLIQYFLEFNRGVFTRLDALRRSGPDGEYKVAIISRRLGAIAKEVDISGTEAAKANIEKYCEGLEKSLLAQFDQAYSQADREIMSQIARTLLDFNGGNSCVQTYVNQHAFFINLLKIAEDDQEGNGTSKRDFTKVDPGLIRLYEEIRVAIFNEWEVIHDVFPNAASVLQVFVQRIFAQSIQNYLESLMEKAQNASTIAFLQSLELSHSATAQLVADIHRFDEDVISLSMGAPIITTMLNRCFEDLFVPYLENDHYFDLEKEWLTDTIHTHLSEQLKAIAATGASHNQKNKSHSASQSPNRKSIGRALASTSPAKEAASATATSQISSVAAMSSFMTSMATTMTTMSNMGVDLGHQLTGQSANQAAAVSEGALVPTIDDAIICTRAYLESMHRCKELCEPAELPTYASLLFKLLVNELGTNYIQQALDNEIEEFMLIDPKNDAEFGHLETIKTSTRVLQLLQFLFQAQLAPMLTGAPAIQREMLLFKNEFFSGLEQKANRLLLKKVSAVVSWLEVLLARQRKTDFKPRDDIVAVNTLATSVCLQIVDFIRRIKEEAEVSLDGENLETYHTEIGLSLHSLLLEHFKKFPISYAGGLVLTKDLSKYHETIMSFKIELLQERFDMLKELGNLFIVKPQNLKTVINEGYLVRIELQLLYPYLSLRADWSKLVKLEKELFEVDSGEEVLAAQ